jgi:hypothetical protein
MLISLLLSPSLETTFCAADALSIAFWATRDRSLA